MSGPTASPARFGVDVVAIDLDGTLVDTLRDLSRAANRMLAGLALPSVSEADVRGFIGQGITSLVVRCLERASGDMAAAADVAVARALFERMYEEGEHQQSRLYPGAIEGLDELSAAGFRLCCITNKAARFTTPLLIRAGIAERFDLVLSGDSLPRSKPDPLPLIHASRWFRADVSRLLLVGDSVHDTLAARAAGCPVICVDYGYSGQGGASALDCDGRVHSLQELPALLCRPGPTPPSSAPFASTASTPGAHPGAR